MKFIHDLYKFLVLGLILFADPPAGGGGEGGAAPAGAGAGGAAPVGAAPAGGTGGGAAPAGGAAPPAPSGPLIDPATGKFAPGFAAKYPELAKKFTEPDALVGSYVNLEKMINGKGIIKPGPNATPQQVADYYAALGRPPTAADYGLKAPEKLTLDGKEVTVPKSLWEAETAAKATELFHKIGLTTEQAQALTQFDLERGLRAMGGLEAQMAARKLEAETAMKEKWPGANYDREMKAARDAASKLGLTPEVLNANPELGNSPLFIEAMAKVAAMSAERPAAGARGGTFNGQDAASEIAAIMADKNHPWQAHNAKANPKAHTDAVQYMKRLYQIKNGEI